VEVIPEFVMSRLPMAFAAFGAVFLAVIATALIWEAAQSVARWRSLERELQRLADAGRPVGLGKARTDAVRRPHQVPDWLGPLLERVPRLTDVTGLLEQAHSTWSVTTFFILTAGVGLASGTLLALIWPGLLSLVFGAAAGATLPYLHLARKRARRIRAFEEGFPDAIDLMVRSARAGHAFQSGLREVAEESVDPVGSEFRQVFEEQKFGLPLNESLLGLADRVDLVDVRLFVVSAIIQRETGGNLAENLDKLSSVIRQRLAFRRQVRVHTAHGRMTSALLGATPIVMTVLLTVSSPEYMKPLFEEPLGRWLLVGAVALQLFGFFVIRRLTDLEF
jgi:tight adherence protein B